MFISAHDQRQMMQEIGEAIVWTPKSGRASIVQGVIEHRDIERESDDHSMIVAGQETILQLVGDDARGVKKGDVFRRQAGGISYSCTPLPSDGSGFLEFSLMKVS